MYKVLFICFSVFEKKHLLLYSNFKKLFVTISKANFYVKT